MGEGEGPSFGSSSRGLPSLRKKNMFVNHKTLVKKCFKLSFAGLGSRALSGALLCADAPAAALPSTFSKSSSHPLPNTMCRVGPSRSYVCFAIGRVCCLEHRRHEFKSPLARWTTLRICKIWPTRPWNFCDLPRLAEWQGKDLENINMNDSRDTTITGKNCS